MMKYLLGLSLVFFASIPVRAVTNTIVATNAVWKYLDNGSNPGAGWTGGGFNDSSWDSGPGPLGYGDGDEATVVKFGPDPNNRYITTYFRHGFNIPDPNIYAVLLLAVRRDDGVVVYLNGQEVFRSNLRNGTIATNTLATSASDDGDTPQRITVSPALLEAGANVIAAEIHQATADSTDISFDLELRGSTDLSADNPPVVSVSAPRPNASYTEPAALFLAASATDADGKVTRVEFFEANTKLGEDTSAPFSFVWGPVPAGNYSLRAVATDNINVKATSAVVNVTVELSTIPTLASISPAPGNVSRLSQLTLRFSEVVRGVDADDLLINGRPATGVSGEGANYTFTFPAPRDGTVRVAWVGQPGIVDFENPPKAFDPFAPGATWQYNLADTGAPTISVLNPVAGASVRSLTKIEVTFDEPVWGVDAADLRINGVGAEQVTGTGSGPYVFEFNQPTTPSVSVAWAVGHGIRDFAGTPNSFAGSGWSYGLNPGAVFEGQVVLNEIMYQPASQRPEDEWIELHNRGGTAVNLAGWALRRGVNFSLPNTTLAAGGYLVVAANVSAFSAKYSGVGNVVGGWTGRLGNSYDEVELEDAQGQRVDLVNYADQGDFAVRVDVPGTGWDWRSAADGGGSSLELRQAALENNTGQNWEPSRATNGTPGRVNSAATADLAPLILQTIHSPVIPRSTDPVTITARILDEQPGSVTARLWYRDVTTNSSKPFVSVTMADNGLNNDGTTGDGLYGARLPAMTNRTIIEFYVEARDGAGQTRTWPTPGVRTNNTPVQTANALFQVDDEAYGGSQAIYRLILTATDRNNLFNQRDSVQRNATFITVEGAEVQVRYNCDVRRRGATSFGSTPPTLKLNIPTDRTWNGKSSINLNSVNTWAQVLGSAVCAQAGLSAAYARAVQVRFNGVNESRSDSQQFGSYAHVEVVNDEWARDHLSADSAGNLYSKRRPECGLHYQGSTIQAYLDCAYEKESNRSENDWTDLMDLTLALDPATTPDLDYVHAVRQNLNVELWLRYFAVLFLMNYTETALATGVDDDYDLYRGIVDPRFLLLPHDFDSIFGSSGNGPTNLFLATTNLPVVARFLRHPEFQPLYYAEYRRLLDGAFATNSLFPLFDQVLGGWIPDTTIQSMRNNALARRNYVAGALPQAPPAAHVTLSGEPASPTYLNTATLIAGGQGVTHYRYRLNGGSYGPETPVGTPISLSGLADGTYTVQAVGRDATGVWQEEDNPTFSRTWTVLSNLRRVIFNEVLARNDSAVNHSGTFPDLIELFNPGTAAADLSGLRLTDDLLEPDKFTFPAGTTLAAGSYLVLYANDPDGTVGLHLGFSLNQNGETIYLLDRATAGPRVLDSIEFGLQLPNLSVGRLAGGRWGLTQPSFGAVNLPAAIGSPSAVRINEWLASGTAPLLEDFIELYNADSLPVALGGLFLTDQPIGLPFRHELAPLSFIASQGYRVFNADDSAAAGAEHLNFQLAGEWGEIALVDADGTILDAVVYGQQSAGISQGRAPDGAPRIAALSQPTPGVGNPVPPLPLPPQLVNFIPYNQTWRYDATGTDNGVAWRSLGFDDEGWPSGPGLLAGVRPMGTLPEAVGTTLTVSNTRPTFYFRAQFTIADRARLSGFHLTHIFDDGAVVYLNGLEVYRYNIGANPVSFGTLAQNNILDPTSQGPILLAPTQARDGLNVLAVEVHQSSTNSADVVMGCKLDGLILTNDPGKAGLVLNEIFANPREATNSDGTITDWVELHNPANASVDLAGLSLTDRLNLPRRWSFPAGTVIAAHGYRVIQLDPDAPASTNLSTTLNAGFGLKASGDSLYLFNRPASGGELLDAVTFGLQAPDWPIARVPNGGATWTLALPTPGSQNLPAALGDPAQLQINEWMANPASGGDWFELYNAAAQPVSLAGLHLTDDLGDRFKHSIPPLSFIGTGLLGFQRFEADSQPTNGADHVNFKLAQEGEALGLTDVYGAFLDSVTFGVQSTGVSQGRLPDATDNIVSFLDSPTPGESNYLPIPSVVINEVLTHSVPPLEDAIELRNTTGAPVDISGWYLSDARTFLTKFRIPDGTIIPAHGFHVFYENQFNPRPGDPDSFALSSSQGDQVFLSAALGGFLTGERAVAEFGAAERNVSFGRFVTSVGIEFVALSRRTFGQDNADSVEQFRTGTGLDNADPKVGPIVISEVMYHPPDIGAEDNVVDEYIQLANLTALPVKLFDPIRTTNRWRFRGAVKFDFPANTTIPAGGTLLVVSFNPATNAAARDQFFFDYDLPDQTALVGPYEGKLDNSSDRIELYKPDDQFSGAAASAVPYILVEQVAYTDQPPWPTVPDGTGFALRRASPSLFANDPANWMSIAPFSSPPDRDYDGLPDSWESQYHLNPDSAADVSQDPDHDGQSNRDEYFAGTDPTNPASRLELKIVSLSPVTLEFLAAANKSYTIEFRNSLTAGTWAPLAHVDALPTPRVVRWPDSPGGLRFYRLRTPRVQ